MHAILNGFRRCKFSTPCQCTTLSAEASVFKTETEELLLLQLVLCRGVLRGKLLAAPADVEDAGLHHSVGAPGDADPCHGRLAEPLGLCSELWHAVLQAPLPQRLRFGTMRPQALGPWSKERLLSGHLRTRALKNQLLGVIKRVHVEVAAMPVLALFKRPHFDDRVNVLGPPVHDEVHDLREACFNSPQGQVTLPWVDEALLHVSMEGHVDKASDEELRWHVLEDLLTVPGHHAILHWLDDECVAA
mmetsp:Transcript_14288/g.30007  ORF Transcript_14288/g.30007 Transcript_14288/m.30007 type:complete len:246 (+) Transcript_14288:303-1040(+)